MCVWSTSAIFPHFHLLIHPLPPVLPTLPILQSLSFVNPKSRLRGVSWFEPLSPARLSWHTVQTQAPSNAVKWPWTKTSETMTPNKTFPPYMFIISSILSQQWEADNIAGSRWQTQVWCEDYYFTQCGWEKASRGKTGSQPWGQLGHCIPGRSSSELVHVHYYLY
jgi:hypothetical protein